MAATFKKHFRGIIWQILAAYILVCWSLILLLLLGTSFVRHLGHAHAFQNRQHFHWSVQYRNNSWLSHGSVCGLRDWEVCQSCAIPHDYTSSRFWHLGQPKFIIPVVVLVWPDINTQILHDISLEMPQSFFPLAPIPLVPKPWKQSECICMMLI